MVLYEMLTGRPPFRGVNLVDTLEQVRWVEPASPSQFVPRLHRDLNAADRGPRPKAALILEGAASPPSIKSVRSIVAASALPLSAERATARATTPHTGSAA